MPQVGSGVVMTSKVAISLLVAVILGILAAPCWAAPQSIRDHADASPPLQKSVVPWLVGLLLILLAAMPLFKKSKRAGYQDR